MLGVAAVLILFLALLLLLVVEEVVGRQEKPEAQEVALVVAQLLQPLEGQELPIKDLPVVMVQVRMTKAVAVAAKLAQALRELAVVLQ
jgi:hypothetical protein